MDPFINLTSWFVAFDVSLSRKLFDSEEAEIIVTELIMGLYFWKS